MIFVYLNVNMSLLLSFFKTVKIKYFDNKNGIECEQFKIVITIKEQFVFFLLLLFMEWPIIQNSLAKTKVKRIN
jgi:hypothetical protein